MTYFSKDTLRTRWHDREQREYNRVTSLTMHAVKNQICRLNAIMDYYCIRKARQIINLDQCGISLRAKGAHVKRKLLTKRNTKPFRTTLRPLNRPYYCNVSYESQWGSIYTYSHVFIHGFRHINASLLMLQKPFKIILLVIFISKGLSRLTRKYFVAGKTVL